MLEDLDRGWVGNLHITDRKFAAGNRPAMVNLRRMRSVPRRETRKLWTGGLRLCMGAAGGAGLIF